jgi:hypothetical protein
MKFAVYVTCLYMLTAFLGSCHKSNGVVSFQPSDTAKTITIFTKWNLIKDSSLEVFGPGPANYRIYNGGAADYWDFRGDGDLYVREGVADGPFPYLALPADTLSFPMSGLIAGELNGKYLVIGLTVHQATLRYTAIPNPGSFYQRVIYLQR